MLNTLLREQVRFLETEERVLISASDIEVGTNHFDDLIVHSDGTDVRVYDRVCDHNGGKLISQGGVVRCPLHHWCFDPASGAYTNVDVAKTPLVVGRHGEPISVPIPVKRRERDRRAANKTTSIRFLNHACLLIETPDVRFATDPWLMGPAFCSGWWLAKPSPVDAIDMINACDFLYISHNHPDHLHLETLEHVRKDMPILTARFESGSTVRMLESAGFTQILAMEFDRRLVGDGYSLSVLPSGDFRDDSGLLFEVGDFAALLTVDSNFIDFFRFPEGVSVLASSFAGGASGYPLCFDTLSAERKAATTARNRGAIRAANQVAIERCRPAYFLPYAGFFEEKAERDSEIRRGNRKNSVADYRSITDKAGAKLLDVGATDRFEFDGGTLRLAEDTQTQRRAPENTHDVVARRKAQDQITPAEVLDYFRQSRFVSDLLLYISATDDDFDPDWTIRFDFRDGTGTQVPSPDRLKPAAVNVLHCKVRHDALAEVIRRGLPWEDISIGFQCRVDRVPDVYNSDFWFHFTNVYVADEVKRAQVECGACDRVGQALAAS